MLDCLLWSVHAVVICYVALGEKSVYVFEFQSYKSQRHWRGILKTEEHTLSFGEEEIDDRHPESVQDGEDDVRLPANVANSDRGYLNN